MSQESEKKELQRRLKVLNVFECIILAGDYADFVFGSFNVHEKLTVFVGQDFAVAWYSPGRSFVITRMRNL